MAIAVVSSTAAACASDGRELAEGRSWQTTTTRPLPPTSAPPQSEGATGLLLTSPDFEPGGLAPLDATCAGANLPPTLEWNLAGSAPTDTAEWAVSLSDQTDPENPLLLWLVVGIEPTVGQLVPGDLGLADETLNDYGQQGFGTPCLEGFESGRRDLQFKLYVMDTPSGLESGAPGNTSWDDITAKAVETATGLTRVDAATNP